MRAPQMTGSESEVTLKQLVLEFSTLEGRQPRALVCQSRKGEENDEVKRVSVELAGYGFDVDMGIPFDSFIQVGRSAIESDVDLLILFGIEGGSGNDFKIRLDRYFSEAGYSDIFVLQESQQFSAGHFQEELISWLEKTLR